MEISLYPFQAKSIEALRNNIRIGIRNQILAAPTGSGKTVCGLYLIDECRNKKKRALFVCDRIALIDQTSAMLDLYGISHGVIQANHWRYRPWELVQVASAQTLARRNWPEADLIIVDEAHTILKTVIDRIKERNTITIGLTATPFTRGLGKHYDSVVTVTTTNELIQGKYLSPFRVFAASEPDMTGAKVVAGEWTDDEAAKRSMPIIGDCVAEYLKHGEGRKFIAFGVNVNHCAELQKQFLAAGVQCALYTYQTGDEERTEMVKEFRKPDSYLRGLISVSALAKGFDVSDVGVIIMARPLRTSLAEHIQILGRGLRSHPGKVECTVLDHSGNMLRFWEAMHEFFEHGAVALDDGKRKEKKKPLAKAKQPFKCSRCFHVHSPMPNCPACGFEYPRRNMIEHLAGNLQEIPDGPTATRDEKQVFYSQLLDVAYQRSYKEGWANHKYRARFGVWPAKDMLDIRVPASRQVLNWIRRETYAWKKALKA